MAERFDAPKPCSHATPHVSSFGPKWFLTADERDRYDSMVRTGQIRLDADESKLDARQRFLKRQSTLKPLGQQYFSKEK